MWNVNKNGQTNDLHKQNRHHEQAWERVWLNYEHFERGRTNLQQMNAVDSLEDR